MKDKGYFFTAADNRSVFHIAAYAEPLALGLIAHLTEFGNGFVVGFALADAAQRPATPKVQ